MSNYEISRNGVPGTLTDLLVECIQSAFPSRKSALFNPDPSQILSFL
ncbi:MAG: hypothetical protein HWE30_19195 [Methylocystaceae bacterium]|nr:hypothetical protein [Methylocystaceae bacterium]